MATSATATDRQRLSEFLDKVQEVLKMMVDGRDLLFRQALRDAIDKAWPDVQLAIDAVKIELTAHSRPSRDEALANAGLCNAQLTLKLRGFDRAYDRFQKRGTLVLLAKLLKWINAILGSLASAIPGAEPIKEFKEALEADINDDDPTD
jgi:hypothetical protein